MKKNLVIQTAKIGDYANSSIMFEPLKNFDIIIDKINIPFAQYDTRINDIYNINDYKINFFMKLKLAFKLFWNNYENIYILMPNNLNLFLGQMSFAKNKNTIVTYASKWYIKILSYGMNKVKHTVEDLTLDSYLKLIDINYDHSLYKKQIQKPLQIPNYSLVKTDNFKVGISLTAANKLKTIDIDTWKEIFSILDQFNITIYIFGLENEQPLLDNLLNNISLSNSKIISLLGKVELKYLPYEISKMDIYISSDTGNSYIANCFNVAIINFAGPCFWIEQRPVGEKVLIVKSNASCIPYSSVFKTSHIQKCANIFSINKEQYNQIKKFIKSFYIID